MWRDNWKIWLWFYRKGIDSLDSLLIKLLYCRMHICKRIGKIKIEHHLPVYVPEREKVVLIKRVKQAAMLGFSDGFIKKLARAVFSESKREQKELAVSA